MRYEEYTATNENLLRYWFEVDEIECGKAKKGGIDTILNDWLKTHSPTDISDDEEPGADW